MCDLAPVCFPIAHFHCLAFFFFQSAAILLNDIILKISVTARAFLLIFLFSYCVTNFNKTWFQFYLHNMSQRILSPPSPHCSRDNER